MRVVLDTNIIISGIFSPRGAPRALLDLMSRGDVHVVTSPVLLDELEEVLRRFPPSPAAAEIRAALDEVAYVVEAASTPSVTRDPDDDHVLAAAVAGDAVYVITRDQHLLTLGSYRGIAILQPAPALHSIRAVLGGYDG